MTARDTVDAVVDSKLNMGTGGPVTRADANAVATAILDYVDEAVVTDIGTVNTAVDGLTGGITRVGSLVTMVFTLDGVEIPHTDAAGSGSSGSIKLIDMEQGAFVSLASICNLGFLGDTLIDTNVGDMAFVYGVGSAAANAGDAALTSAEVDIVPVSSTVTLSSFIATSERIGAGVSTGINLTASGGAFYLNESGSAATSDANGVLAVTGTITIVLLALGDN